MMGASAKILARSMWRNLTSAISAATADDLGSPGACSPTPAEDADEDVHEEAPAMARARNIQGGSSDGNAMRVNNGTSSKEHPRWYVVVKR